MDLSFTIGGKQIEAAWHGPQPERAATLVLLHEGLGSVAMWKEFPQNLAERTGYGVLVYSRSGYGNSDPVELPRPLTYMHDEACEILPAVLDQAGVRKAILVGHSDGASIATIYAGSRQDFRVRGLVLIAPHFFVEDVSVHSIAAVKDAYETGDLRGGSPSITATSTWRSGAGTRPGSTQISGTGGSTNTWPTSACRS